MQYVRDWYDQKEDCYVVQCARRNTIVLFAVTDAILNLCRQIERETEFTFVVAHDLENVYAIPAFLAFVDTTGIEKEREKGYFDFIEEYSGPDDCYVILLNQPKLGLRESLSSFVQVVEPDNLDREQIDLLINKIKSEVLN